MQPAPRRYRDGNSLRTIMRRKGDTLASMRISSCRQGGGILGALGSDSARVQGLKVIFYFFYILFHRSTYTYICISRVKNLNSNTNIISIQNQDILGANRVALLGGHDRFATLPVRGGLHHHDQGLGYQ